MFQSRISSNVLPIPILVLFLICLMIGTGCDEGTVTPPSPPLPIEIGSLLAETGSESSIGESCKAGIQVAVEEITEYIDDNDLNRELVVYYEDTTSDSTTALAKLESLASGLVSFVIGPTLDESVGTISPWAAQNEVLLLSPSSVGIQYAIEDDNIYRFAPTDLQQSKALAALLEHDGIEAVVTFASDDEWADNLLESLESNFTNRGGVIHSEIRYDNDLPIDSTYLDSLEDKLDEADEIYSDSSIAVCFFERDDLKTADFFDKAKDAYVINVAPWYGSEGSVRNQYLEQDVNLGSTAVTLGGFPCPVFSQQSHEESEIVHKIRLKLDGTDPSAYALAAYDAVWVAFKTYEGLGVTNPGFADLKSTFLDTVNSYIGETGSTALDQAGDRLNGDFDFWKIRQMPDAFPVAYEWYKFATYLSVQDHIHIIPE